MKTWLEAESKSALPKSPLGVAIGYVRNRWEAFLRYTDEGYLSIDNNLSERTLRTIALGRKNWIHIGSPQAGPKVAAILSIVETCRRLHVPIRQYLAAVLPGLGKPCQSKLAMSPDLLDSNVPES